MASRRKGIQFIQRIDTSKVLERRRSGSYPIRCITNRRHRCRARRKGISQKREGSAGLRGYRREDPTGYGRCIHVARNSIGSIDQMIPNTLAIRQPATVVQSVQSATPYRGWFARIAQLLCRLPFKPLCKPCKPCNCTHCTTISADPADPANCALCGSCGREERTNQPRSQCPWPKHRGNSAGRQLWKKFHNRTAEVGGSRKLSHELVKTLFVISPIVNFPAQCSQSPMIPHISNAHLNFYVLLSNLV